jgi:transcriptional regulator with XRE-family HTH domain
MIIDKILSKIRSKRQTLNYSQEYVASLLKISQGSYNKIENGTTELTVNMLFEISEILNLDKTELFQLNKKPLIVN